MPCQRLNAALLCLCLLKESAGVTKQREEKRKKVMIVSKNALPPCVGKQKQADSQTEKGMKQGALGIVRHKKKERKEFRPKISGGPSGTRTPNQLIKSQLLYQLS
jgi:hypothetical protein